mmetsp:Transcript_127420/g.321958  ORF Transcript_127420/g.321958 Transcript_127420/m.321958 type:complete len:252 (-) Transcript_127420:1816-2571(-)
MLCCFGLAYAPRYMKHALHSVSASAFGPKAVGCLLLGRLSGLSPAARSAARFAASAIPSQGSAVGQTFFPVTMAVATLPVSEESATEATEPRSETRSSEYSNTLSSATGITGDAMDGRRKRLAASGGGEAAAPPPSKRLGVAGSAEVSEGARERAEDEPTPERPSLSLLVDRCFRIVSVDPGSGEDGDGVDRLFPCCALALFFWVRFRRPIRGPDIAATELATELLFLLATLGEPGGVGSNGKRSTHSADS